MVCLRSENSEHQSTMLTPPILVLAVRSFVLSWPLVDDALLCQSSPRGLCEFAVSSSIDLVSLSNVLSLLQLFFFVNKSRYSSSHSCRSLSFFFFPLLRSVFPTWLGTLSFTQYTSSERVLITDSSPCQCNTKPVFSAICSFSVCCSFAVCPRFLSSPVSRDACGFPLQSLNTIPSTMFCSNAMTPCPNGG